MSLSTLKRILRWISAAGLAVLAVNLPLPPFSAPRAEALIGRPITPGSAAGVARRTTRRTVAVGAAAVGTAAAASTYHHALPYADCYQTTINATPYYDCHGTYYRPVQDGPDTVYVIEQPNG